jgi:phage tail sheath protein FI
VALVLDQQSNLLRVAGDWTTVPTDSPTTSTDPVDPSTDPFGTANPNCHIAALGGFDGTDLGDLDVTGDPAEKTGIYALLKADLFNLLCITPPKPGSGNDVGLATYQAAMAFCQERRAILIVDSPSSWSDASRAVQHVDGLGLRNPNTVLYFPRVRMANPLKDNQVEEFVPCGVMAGVMARTDGTRGVWKAPAGMEAGLIGVRDLSYKLTDGENGQLNPLAVNCLRSFPVVGEVCWGARTLQGADQLASQWKYLPVRRLALYIEESLYRGTQWAVFEPNDTPLWAQLRLNIGAFMHNLFRQGAFQGSSPRDAYLVKCDSDTTTQNDIDAGIVNILVGFAPLKPAEFVIIQIQQLAGQVQA